MAAATALALTVVVVVSAVAAAVVVAEALAVLVALVVLPVVLPELPLVLPVLPVLPELPDVPLLLEPVLPLLLDPVLVVVVVPSSAETSAAFAATRVAFACARVASTEVGSTLASFSPLVTVSPADTYTLVSVPPVTKLSPASEGETSEPVPETVASTVPRSTVASVVVLDDLPLELLVPTAAYAAPAPATSPRASSEFSRTALRRRRGSTFMPWTLNVPSIECLG